MTAPERLVLDGSIALAWCFPDEQAPYPQSVLDALGGKAEAVVPALWPLEVANALLMGERRKRSSQMDTVAWMGFLSALPITVDTEAATRAFGDIVNLARTHRLTVYDATYLELAMRLGVGLATLDDELADAAKAVGVALYKPATDTA
jgi:predicted nucleic acid-binding protein